MWPPFWGVFMLIPLCMQLDVPKSQDHHFTKQYPNEFPILTLNPASFFSGGAGVIRAQRLCSTMRQFIKSGYRRLHRRRCSAGMALGNGPGVGKFLVRWWTARELRQGELCAWFRRMLRNAKRMGEGAVRSPISEGAGMGGRAFVKRRASSGTQTTLTTMPRGKAGGGGLTQGEGPQCPVDTVQRRPQEQVAP